MDTITRFIPQDKLLHLIAGAVIAVSALVVATFFAPVAGLVTQWIVPALGAYSKAAFAVFSASAAGVVKEIIDWVDNWNRRRKGLLARHDVELQDYLYTAGGGFFVGLCTSIVVWLMP